MFWYCILRIVRLVCILRIRIMENYTQYGYCSTATLSAYDIYKGKLYDFFAKLTPNYTFSNIHY